MKRIANKVAVETVCYTVSPMTYALLVAHAPTMVSPDELELSQIDASNVGSALRELKAAGLIRWTEE